MATTNVIEFAPALRRRQERQSDRAVHAGHHAPWRSRYRDGIDGLWGERRAQRSGEIVRLVTPGSRLGANG
ncbi:MAG: hypothetical protein R3D05_16240 [Dongiaceae bacterium]